MKKSLLKALKAQFCSMEGFLLHFFLLLMQGCIREQSSCPQHVFVPVGIATPDPPDRVSQTFYEHHWHRWPCHQHGARLFYWGTVWNGFLMQSSFRFDKCVFCFAANCVQVLFHGDGPDHEHLFHRKRNRTVITAGTESQSQIIDWLISVTHWDIIY